MAAHQTFDTDFTPSQHRTPAEVVNQETNVSAQTKNNAASAQETAVNMANQAKASRVSDGKETSATGTSANLNPVMTDQPKQANTNDDSAAANVYNSAVNSQTAQELANGPAAQNIKKEMNATSNEFSDLANSRKTPDYKAANDTTLTHYHSFFWNLLSWRNPRATGITFVMSLISIFACRYMPIVSMLLKGTWTVLGVVTLAELGAKLTIGSSAAAKVRPRKYYTIPKETLETAMDDVEQLINFFVIEVQRIVLAENVVITGTAFFVTLLSYFLIKLLPAWGFSLFATSVVFLVPLIYTSNKEFIDTQIEHASHVVVEQTQQVRDLAAENTRSGLETVKQYTGDYANLAGEYIGKSRQKIPQLANNAAESTKQTVNNAAASVQSTASDVSARVQSTASDVSAQAQSKANDVGASVRSTANDASAQAQSKANDVGASVQSTANDVSARTQTGAGYTGYAGDQTRDTTYQTYQPYQERDTVNSSNVYVKQEEFPNAPSTGLYSSASHTRPVVLAPGSNEPAASAAAI